MRLYWRPGTAAMAPHAALAEIGADYELVLVESGDAGRPEYLALNPSGRVPTLEDGETVITESAAIMLHLADRYPEAGLAPLDRAAFYSSLIFLTNTLQTALMRFIYRDRYGGAGVLEAAVVEAQGIFERLEAALEGREWLIGDTRTASGPVPVHAHTLGPQSCPSGLGQSQPASTLHEDTRPPRRSPRMMEEQDLELRPGAAASEPRIRPAGLRRADLPPDGASNPRARPPADCASRLRPRRSCGGARSNGPGTTI